LEWSGTESTVIGATGYRVALAPDNDDDDDEHGAIGGMLGREN
jgi:hypothetical protein